MDHHAPARPVDHDPPRSADRGRRVDVVAVAVASGTLGAVGVVAFEWLAVLAVPLVLSARLAVGDQRTARLPNRDTATFAALTAVAVTVGVLAQRGSITAVAAGAAIWCAPLLLAALAGGIAGGDFKYGTSLGALCGWISVGTAATGLLLALLAGSTVGIITATRNRDSRAAVRLGLPLHLGAVAAIVIAGLQP